VHGWPALAAAQAHAAAARVPFSIGPLALGSVARAHLATLRELASALASHPDRAGATDALRGDDVALRVDDDGVRMLPAAAIDPALIDATLRPLNHALRAAGLILAWRDEDFPLLAPSQGSAGPALRPLGRIERAACRFWGTLTRGAHVNGWVAGADGRPTHLWIGRRSRLKATDPGMLDNLVGGGIGCDQTPMQTVVREAWEEAGLPAELAAQAQPRSVLGLHRDVPEGRMVEHLHVFDLLLPRGLHPVNQDGEVAGFECLAMADALAAAREGAMTVDAALVTLDFALRHALVSSPDAPSLTQALRAMRVD
jgi:8-oxo-dGTP pyrophosphatase MutT (NUDIX family)